MQKNELVKDMKVYVTSCWWRDNDPFVRIAGNNADVVRKSAETAMYNAAEDAFNGEADEDTDTTIADHLDRIAWSGVSAMNLHDVASSRDIQESPSEYESLINGDKDAILYLET